MRLTRTITTTTLNRPWSAAETYTGSRPLGLRFEALAKPEAKGRYSLVQHPNADGAFGCDELTRPSDDRERSMIPVIRLDLTRT